MKKIVLFVLSISLWGCLSPDHPLSGYYEIVAVDCDEAYQDKLANICVGKCIYRSTSDHVTFYNPTYFDNGRKFFIDQPQYESEAIISDRPYLRTKYKNVWLNWFNTSSGFIPNNSGYNICPSYGMSQKRGIISLYAPNNNRVIKLKFRYVGSNTNLETLDIYNVISYYYDDKYIFNEYLKIVQAKCVIREFHSGELFQKNIKDRSLLVSVNIKGKKSFNYKDIKVLEYTHPTLKTMYAKDGYTYRWTKFPSSIMASLTSNIDDFQQSQYTYHILYKSEHHYYDYYFNLPPKDLKMQ